MISRALPVALLLVATGLAGCFGAGQDDALDPDAKNETGFNKEKPDGETLLAFEETNQTEAGAGGVDHHHDYWQGANRVVIFDTPATMEPYPDDQNRATATFRPPQGTFVYEGTQTVEFTITKPQRRACPYGGTFDGEYPCTDNTVKIVGSVAGQQAPADGAPRADDPSPPAGLKLRYKHASTTQWIDAGELAWDRPTLIKITDPRHTDMPHATSSLWEFEVVSPHANDVTLTFHAKAEVVRGEGDIPLWPGHPNFYADRTSRVVLDKVGAEACDQSGCTLANADNLGPVAADKLISYGTKTLHVWVNITDAQFPIPATAPQSWFLYHHNATGRDNVTNQFDTEAAAIEKREFYWILPVDDNGMDSPYADGSRWEFDLGAALVTPIVSCYGNCADWHATYNIVIHATNEVLPLESYHNYCLRDEDCAYRGA